MTWTPSTARFDVSVLEQVKGIVSRTLAPTPVDVYLFGSRASGRARATSDIDVAIDAAAPLPRGVLVALRDALEESTIPYRVDVVDLAETDSDFRERIRREGVLWIASGSA